MAPRISRRSALKAAMATAAVAAAGCTPVMAALVAMSHETSGRAADFDGYTAWSNKMWRGSPPEDPNRTIGATRKPEGG